jgi:Transposase
MEKMTKSKRGRYTLEFKQEAVRLVESGQSQAAVCRSLGVVKQTLGNWVSEHRTDGEQPSACGVGACDDGARHTGKSDGVLCEVPEMKYAFIQRNRLVWPISVQCRVLLVSVSGYHEHLARGTKRSKWVDMIPNARPTYHEPNPRGIGIVSTHYDQQSERPAWNAGDFFGTKFAQMR